MPAVSVKHTGSCRCGKIRFRALGSARTVVNCHCRDCQKNSGGPFMVWALFRTEHIKFTAGEPALYSEIPGKDRGFCAHCGTPLFWQDSKLNQWIDMAAMAFDKPEQFLPKSEIWVSRRIDWVHALPDIPQYEKGIGES